jgi:two-component system, LytTR family, response regulator
MWNEQLSCMVVDDEDLAITLLKAYIHQTTGIELVAALTVATAVPAMLAEQPADILFLDIQMPSVNGLALAETLVNAPMIVFTTAYPNYAVDGFRLNAIDYLLKPFSYERFLQAVAKCREYRQYQLLKQKAAIPGCIYVRSDGRMVKILLSDILFIEGLKQYIKIYTSNKYILTLESMKNMEETLPAGQFIRIHKSYIVALDKVDGFSSDEWQVGKHSIAVGKTYREGVKKWVP